MSKFYRLLRYDWPMHLALFLTNWLPDNVIFLKFRGSLARLFLGSCGHYLKLARNITLYNPARIHFGNNIYIAYGCWLSAGEDIVVDDEVIFGPYCVVASENHSRLNGSFRFGEMKRAPIRIKRGSWLSAHVTLTAGSVIGEGSLIAAGAVVTKEIPANVLAGGVPARVLKEIGDAG